MRYWKHQLWELTSYFEFFTLALLEWDFVSVFFNKTLLIIVPVLIVWIFFFYVGFYYNWWISIIRYVVRYIVWYHLTLTFMFLQLLEHLLAILTFFLFLIILKILKVAWILTIQLSLVFLFNFPQFTLFNFFLNNLNLSLVT